MGVIDVRTLTAAEARIHLPALAAVLADCVKGGASVSFMSPFTQTDGERFFESVIRQAAAGERLLFAAFLDSKLVGTVQLITATPPNQPHRADVAKLLVLREARGQGVATRLMTHLEISARNAGKTLLVLDTVTGDPAERLYTQLGWSKVGVIPNYALYPDGRLCDTTVFYKQLAI